MQDKALYYTSTRGKGEEISSAEAIINGIAADGGLYVPSFIPKIDRPFSELLAMDYKSLACYVIGKFCPDFTDEEIKSCVERAYDKKFDTRLIAPVVRSGDAFFLELYHGATAAFKDMALSILPHLLTVAARKTGLQKEIVILTATSGDTGKAAIESFSDVAGTKIIVFYPSMGVSLIQERQMVTQEGENTFVCAIEGNFDDAQTGVKNIFNDKKFNKILNGKDLVFSSANSINIGRLIPQVVYYIYAYLQMLLKNEIEEGQEINLVVPTGNFGNILAAYYASLAGLPVQRLLCASNENNVLYDFINTGIYDRRRPLKMTMSPSMDILVSSNLERLVYDLCGRDPGVLYGLFDDLLKKGAFQITDEMKEKLNAFWAGFATEEQTLGAIGQAYKEYNYLMDTHTAVGYYVYKEYREMTSDRIKTVIASTASPFKFPRSVIRAISKNEAEYEKEYENLDEFALLEKLSELTRIDIPVPLKGIGTKKVLHNNLCKIKDMKSFVANVLDI